MTVLLHRPGLRLALLAREAAAALGAALGREVEVRAGEGEGEREEEGWRLAAGAGLLARPSSPGGRPVLLPRRDPRWSLEDLAKRPLGRLPPGTRVVVGSLLGEALLLRVRPDLLPVRAGAYPLPEETPVLAEGPWDGRPAGDPLDPPAFLPAPGTGFLGLQPPPGREVPPAVRAIEDGEAGTLLAIEAGIAEGVGEIPAGGSLGVLARRRASILYAVRAVLFRPGSAPREVAAEIPMENARTFARGFGRHLAS